MNTIFDKYAADVMNGSELDGDELRALFTLLHKLDPDAIDMGLSWTSATEEDDGDDYYRYAIQNFFSIITGDLVAKYFGDQISGMCQEVDETEFSSLPFVKIIREMAEEMDVERIEKQKPISSVVVINQ
jgi:hypothetical protein